MKTAPQFWFKKSLISYLIAPLGWLYGAIVRYRLTGDKPKLSVRVICVGNLTLGGSGKTPVVIGLVDELKRQGHTPHVLTRGYGGKGWQSVQVDASIHTAKDVGDEPLLLAYHAPTWVGPDRYESGKKAINLGATILILDDGLQSSTVYQDVKIGVFDGMIPLVNTHVFPAGPFREPFQSGLDRLDLILMLNFESLPDWARERHLLCGTTVTAQKPDNQTYIAFAGIGYPQKFFEFLTHQGFNLAASYSFPDHHNYRDDELTKLMIEAKNKQAQLITTEKDLVKIPKNVKKNIQSLKVTLQLDWIELVNKVLKKN